LAKLSGILIGVVVATLIMSAFGLYLGGGVATYGTSGYDDTNILKVSSQFSSIENRSREAEARLLNLSTTQQAQNKLDVLYAGAYSTGFSIAGAFANIFDIGSATKDELAPFLGSFGDILFKAIMVIVSIIIFVYILMHFITKSDRL